MSSRDMTLTELKHTTKSFNDTHTVKVGGFKDNGVDPKPTLKSLDNKIMDLSKKLDSFIEEQRLFNKLILARIDNLVIKNNLKE